MSEKMAKRARSVRQQAVEDLARKYDEYRDGPEGFIKWAEENICVAITPVGESFARWVPLGELPDTKHPDTGRSWKDLWESEKPIFRDALRMENGQFVHSLIIFCWPRGEGKTYAAVYIQMWKFFCWPKQDIKLCANSKDQTKFVQFDLIRKHIENSPKLLAIVGAKNIRDKLIRRRDAKGNVISTIESISTASGIRSNITGYAFSEIFDMKDPEFFQQVHGSIRNMPNALGLIDSTVSSKEHILYKHYHTYLKAMKFRQKFTDFSEYRKAAEEKGIDTTIFFSYRYSKNGDYRDYWNPLQTRRQLIGYKSTFILGGFERYFLNLWSAGAERVFSIDQVDAINYIGVKGSAHSHKELIKLIQRKHEIIDSREQAKEAREHGIKFVNRVDRLDEIEGELWRVEDVYRLERLSDAVVFAEPSALEELGRIYETDWAIIGGIDRAQPMKSRTNARTVFSVMAKGLPGSSSNRSYLYEPMPGIPDAMLDDEERKKKLAYIYFLIFLAVVPDHSLEGLKSMIDIANSEYDGIDLITSETWGVWDLIPWCDDEDIKYDSFAPSMDRQMAAFTELHNAVVSGRLKAPPVQIPGSNSDDIFREEFKMFDHDPDKKWFGSPEKKATRGVQDDVMYSVGWNMYGGRNVTIDDFRPRLKAPFFGQMVQPTGLFGKH